MKTLLREFWMSWETWVAIAGSVMAVAALVIIGLWAQRADYERQLSEAKAESLVVIKAEMRQLATEIDRANREREQMRRAIGTLKDEVQAEDKP